MAGKSWLVVGISGVTCAGKTTLANKLMATLPTFTVYLGQDEYILSDDFPGHLLAPSPLRGLNRESLRSIDMGRMMEDIHTILETNISFAGYHKLPMPKEWWNINQAALKIQPWHASSSESVYPPVLLLDGFLLFNHNDVPPLCSLKYFLTLSKNQCWFRRKNRVYASPCADIKLYFEYCVWPKYKDHFTQMSKADIIFKNGTIDANVLYLSVFSDIMQILEANKP